MKNKLYVGNLSFDTSEIAIRDAFAAFGEVVEVKLMLDRETGRSRGFSFVTMGNPESAQKALTQMGGTMLDGRALRVDHAEERKPRDGGGGHGRQDRW